MILDVNKAIKSVFILAGIGLVSVVGWATFGLYNLITWIF